MRSHRWELGDLNQIHMLADAVATTSRADVILVALHAADELPLEFYAWVDAWLPRRPQTTGTLVGLVDVSGVAESTCRHTEEYLSAVARRGDLACVLCRCGSPIEPASAGRPLEAVVESSAVMGEIYEHWGLNE